jgi:hypothetical protein
MFVHSSKTAPNAGVLLHQQAAGIQDIAFGAATSMVELVADHHAGELAPAVGSHHRHGWVDADGGQMLRSSGWRR